MKKIILRVILIGIIIFSVVGCKQKDTKKNPNIDYIGKWNTVKAVNADTGEETIYLSDVFGSSFKEFGSYLELKEDGSFIDAIIPITDGNKSNNGKYIIENDYYKIGDTYIFLNYSDGNKETLQRVYLDDNKVPYLVLDTLVNGYQLYLKK